MGAYECPERRCTLERALGRERRCPGAACAFWLDAPGVGVCLLEDSERALLRRPELARQLLEVRAALAEEHRVDEAWGEPDDTGYVLPDD